VLALGVIALLTALGESRANVEARGPILRVAGKPFFPIGLYYAPAARFRAARDLGFNTVDVWADTGGSARFALNEASALGLKVIVVLQHAYHDGVLNPDLMQTLVTRFRDHPALLAWYLVDEPQESQRFATTLPEASNLVRRLDPSHPTLIVHNQLGALRMFWQLSDIVGVDPYPVPDVALSIVSHHVEQAGLIVGGRKPVWGIMQAFHKDLPRARSRYPTPAELHNMVYQALVAGATGIYYFSYEWQGILEQRDPTLWQYLGVINRQVAALAPALLEGVNAGSEVAVRSSPWLRTRAMAYDGRTIVLAVNLREEPAAIELKGRCGAAAGAEVLFEGRGLPSSGGSVLDSLPAYGVRAYAC
jgi:hypothetical protein